MTPYLESVPALYLSGKHYLQKLFILFLLSLFSISLSAEDLNIDTIVENADHKPLFIFLHKPHCGHCKRMIELTLGDEKIKQEIAENFVYVDIYTGDKGEVTFNGFKGSRRAFAKSLGYDFYPTSIFIDQNKKMINATPGARKKEFFTDLLLYISSKAYQNTEFETYRDTLDLERDD